MWTPTAPSASLWPATCWPAAASAWTYAKNRCIDIRNGLVMMVSVLVMTTVGSWLSTLVPSTTLGDTSVLMLLVLGLKFLFIP